MNLPLPPDRWDIDRLTEERTEAVSAFGFTLRQARFLVEVMIHSGVFVERQYCVRVRGHHSRSEDHRPPPARRRARLRASNRDGSAASRPALSSPP